MHFVVHRGPAEGGGGLHFFMLLRVVDGATFFRHRRFPPQAVGGTTVGGEGKHFLTAREWLVACLLS